MSRAQAHLAALLTTGAVLVCLVLAGVAGAQTGEGQITGVVTDTSGGPLAGITVAAVPVGSDTIVTTKTNSSGVYVITLDPGTYDVGFNVEVVAEVNTDYLSEIYGGPGPTSTETCIVCGGAPVTVTAGVVTTGINETLPPAPFTQTGTIRPLSGDTIGTVDGRISFKVGCHEDPTGCHGTANLRLGSTTTTPIIARATVSIAPSDVAVLHFTIPLAVRQRLQKAGKRGLEATVAITTPQSRSVTHFRLRS
jgi:Carboxypeptidase regulatory-like domain